MTASDLRTRIVRRASRVHLELPPEVVEAFAGYLQLLARWNRKMNLTSLRDTDAALDRLVIEPAVAARFVPRYVTTLLDVGSGGGSPALPLKICAPWVRMWLVESKTRKAAFLHEAVRHLGLSEVEVEAGRFEEVASRADLHHVMDALTIRAVRIDRSITPGIEQVLAPGGLLLWFGGPSGGDGVEYPRGFALLGAETLTEARGSQLWRFERRLPAGAGQRST